MSRKRQTPPRAACPVSLPHRHGEAWLQCQRATDSRANSEDAGPLNFPDLRDLIPQFPLPSDPRGDPYPSSGPGVRMAEHPTLSR